METMLARRSAWHIRKHEAIMVAAVRTFVTRLFGTYAVAPSATPAGNKPVPVEDHTGGRYFTRTPEGTYVTEPINAPEASSHVAEKTVEDGERAAHSSTSPENHDWTRASGPHRATDLEDPRPATTQTRES
jgi:hypothetical protein